ncbi:MAG: glycosyltransferase family 9 protein [Deltaproteobacteria bacterium]|nr:glycosyltransferase family 9 protein [Candidatus Zymogenaceae bacterium]
MTKRKSNGKRILFAGVNLLGDGLCTTQVVRHVRVNHPDWQITYVAQNEPISQFLDGNPHIDRVIYESDRDKIRSMRGWGNFTRKHLFNVNHAFRVGTSRGLHMTQAYGEVYGVDISSRRPVLLVTDEEREKAREYLPDGPYVCISSHSWSSSVDIPEDRAGNKLWGVSKWRRLFPMIRETGYAVVSLGSNADPKYDMPGIIELHGLPIKQVAAILEAADGFVTIDNGLAHLGAAVNAKMVEIYPECLPEEWVKPHTDYVRIVRGYPPAISPLSVMGALEELISEVQRCNSGGQAAH